MLHISRLLIVLLGHGNFSFEGTLQIIEIDSKVSSLEESDIVFKIYWNIWIVTLISEK